MKRLGAPATAAPIFPLSADASGRYLVDQNGTPFFLLGESAWLLMHKLTAAQTDTYIADRISRGFNSAMMMLMCDSGAIGGGYCVDNNAEGGVPAFTSTPLIPENINSTYWAHIDNAINKFRAAGMVCQITPAYENSTWWAATTSDTVAQNWGAWVGARYNADDFPNIIWVSGGDQRCPVNSRRDAMHLAIWNNGGTQLHTCHNDRFHDGFEEKYAYPNGETWLNLNSVYCDDGSSNGSPYTIPEQCAVERAVAGPFPFYLIEDWYADEHSMTDHNVIAQKWQAICSGACGVNTGTSAIWSITTGYADEYGSAANVGVGKIKDIMAAYPWWTLVPKQDASLVSSFLNSHGTTRICPAIGTYGGGNFAFIAVPRTADSPTVVMTNFSQSSVRGRWWDIGNGSFTTVSGSPFSNTGSQVMAHPGLNSLGGNGWVLVLD